MPEKDISQVLAKAKDFFERAWSASERNDFDYAIDMYLEGLRWVPDAVQDGHIRLRELALYREKKGWPKPSAAEAAERLGAKTALEQMLGAEYLLAKNPGHLPYAEALLKASIAGGYRETAKWIADLMFLANNNAKKPSLQIYLLLKDSYAAIGQIDRAVAACRIAIRLKPGDSVLVSEFKKLLAKQAKADEGDVMKVEDRRLAAVEATLEREAKEDDSQLLAKARAFFEVAKNSSETDNFDYAIDMYLEGLHCAPDALQEGHIPLCELGLRRQGRGGKKPSMMERVKRMGGKNALEQMLNAEYLFARAPDHLPYAEAMLKAAVAGGYRKTAGWIANFVFQGNNAAAKPSVHTYVLLMKSYEALGELDKAVVASQRACRLKPEDKGLTDEYQRLSAELTVASGKYDQEGDFRQSIKDRKGQEKLQAQESVIKTDAYRQSAVEDARKAMAQDSNLPKNIFNMAEALSDLRNDKAEDDAVKLLEDAYEKTRNFSFKQRAGQLKITHLKRRIKEAEPALAAKPRDAQAESRAAELSEQLNETELEHYRLSVENYPTDLRAKYEYGVRLIRCKKYDEAIPLFQEAQRDPRHKITAMDKIGFCFLMKGWYTDAIDVFTRAMEAYEIKDDSIAKDLRYNLARAYQEQGNTEKALEIYRKIAQLDFGYKDIRQQIDKLRGEKTEPTSQ
ncbi:MAG: tetratricopeptide repeat protein [Phycisphaerae bacterium]|nr:tetratricopeptide repeat protein [Phycisphaerae bacterium]MDD5381453.1 tetratricopeptide repeat protein [Phycisphaerae bacterium]